MSKEFVMGAKIRLTDGFSSPVSAMKASTQQFRSTVQQTSQAVGTLGRSAVTANTELAAFSMGSRAAAMSSRAAAGGIAALSASFLGLGNVIGLITGALTLKFAYNWLIKSNEQMEVFENTLTVVMKDAGKAKETLAWATKFAAETPFEIPEIVEATTKLTTYGFTAQKVLGTVGDMASVMGKPLMQAVEAVADAQTGEIERLKEFGITKDMLAAQSQKLGVTSVNNSGQITDQKAFNAALFSLMEERYAGGMAMQSKTFRGMLSNMADFIGTVGREFGKPIFEHFKSGLADTLAFTDKLKADGSFDSMIAGARALSGVLIAAFSWLGQVFQRVITFAGLLWPNIAPVFNFMVNTGLPLAIGLISILADWVLKVADFFINNWGWIEPLLQGIGIAISSYLITQLDFAATRMAVVTAATRAWAVMTAILNAVMAVNPVFLIVLGIGLLIGAIILLVKHWEVVKQKFAEFAQWVLSGLVSAFTYVGQACTGVLTGVGQFFANLIPQAFEWGSNIIKTLVDGIVSMKDYLVNTVSDLFSNVRRLMPFSDAKEGPFSQLTYSGRALMTTFAEGARANAGVLRDVVGGAFAGVGINVGVNPAGNVAGGSQGGRTVQISLGGVTINDVSTSEPADFAERVIDVLYETLREAADIAASGDMEALI